MHSVGLFSRFPDMESFLNTKNIKYFENLCEMIKPETRSLTDTQGFKYIETDTGRKKVYNKLDYEYTFTPNDRSLLLFISYAVKCYPDLLWKSNYILSIEQAINFENSLPNFDIDVHVDCKYDPQLCKDVNLLRKLFGINADENLLNLSLNENTEFTNGPTYIRPDDLI